MLLQQIRPKLNIPRDELSHLCSFFRIGNLIKHRRIREGNVNTNYYVKTLKGEFVFRFYTFKKPLEILAEHEILDYVYRKGFPTPKPIEIGKRTYDFYKQQPVCCFCFAQGKHLDRIQVRNIKEIARVTAKLHNLTKGFRLKRKLEGEGLENVKKAIKAKRLEMVKSDFKDAKIFMDYIQQEIKKINISKNLPRGVVHVDIKNENTLFSHHFETLLDFDNCYLDRFVIDIGSCLMWWCIKRKNFDSKKTRLFIQEYEKIRKITKQEKKYIMESLRFNLLKQAFKYAYICLPEMRFAEKKAYYFLDTYKKLKSYQL